MHSTTLCLATAFIRYYIHDRFKLYNLAKKIYKQQTILTEKQLEEEQNVTNLRSSTIKCYAMPIKVF